MSELTVDKLLEDKARLVEQVSRLGAFNSVLFVDNCKMRMALIHIAGIGKIPEMTFENQAAMATEIASEALKKP